MNRAFNSVSLHRSSVLLSLKKLSTPSCGFAITLCRRNMSTETPSPAFVSTNWLSDAMKSPDFKKNYRIVDGAWDLPVKKRNFLEEHKEKRICCAKYFSFSDCCDKTKGLPHMLPSEETFKKYVEENFKLENNHHVIIYDNSERFGLFSAPRVWWTFKALGHENVSVLDGGLPKWCEEGRLIKSGDPGPEEDLPADCKPYTPNFKPDLVRDFDFMIKNCSSDAATQVVDARPNGRFRGVEPEPRADIISGHIPNSLNVPFPLCFNNEIKMVKSKEAIQNVFKVAGVDLNKPILVSCGSGVTASILSLCLYHTEGKLIPVYDGSWMEWFMKAPEELQIREK